MDEIVIKQEWFPGIFEARRPIGEEIGILKKDGLTAFSGRATDKARRCRRQYLPQIFSASASLHC
jgi:hypothetical protein